jgi:hypothetical protein
MGIADWQRNNYYKLLVQTGEDKLFSDKSAPRLVVLVRDDILPPLHQGIQAMHSVITLAQTVKIDPRCYLILLGVSGEQMETYAERVQKRYKKACAAYSDPGLVDPESEESPVTACAFEPMTAEEVREGFGGLRRAS